MSKTSKIGWIILFIGIAVGLEILFNWKLFIPLIIGCVLVYQGKQSLDKKNIYYIFGYSLIAIPFLSSGFLRLLIFIVAIYLLHEYYKSKKQLETIVVHTVEPEEKQTRRREPYFKNSFFGNRQEVNQIYEWDDINIHCGFGESVVDLGMTMLPQGESVVVIRGFISNIQILVPFDVDVIVNHSVLSGKLKVFDEEENDLFNSNIILNPVSNQDTTRTIKIITNVLIGNVEVKRI